MPSISVQIKIQAIPFVLPVAAGIIPGTPDGQPGSATGPGVPPPEPVTPETPLPKDWSQLAPSFSTIPSAVVDKLTSALKKLDAVMKVVKALLDVIEIFINDWSSFATLLKAVVDALNKQIDDFVKDLQSTGVYLNFFVPPSFYQKVPVTSMLKHMSAGGFQGFLSRLQTSFYSPTQEMPDKNPLTKTFLSKPTFGPQAQVGGFVIIADTQSLDEFFAAMRALYRFFDFLDIFGINFTPQPPTNIRGTCVIAEDPKTKENKLSVNLEWDPPVTAGDQWLYKVYRDTSVNNPAHYIEKSQLPERLGGPKGLINWVKTMFATGVYKLPTITEYEYKDDKGLFTPTTAYQNSFLDTNLDASFDPTTGTYKVNQLEYYYVVETVPLLVPGSKSTPYRMVIKGCADGSITCNVVEHPDAVFEKLGPNSPWQWPWVSFRPLEMIPVIPLFANLMKKVLNMFAGAVMSVTNSFLEYVKALVAKINSYLTLLQIISALVQALKDFTNMPPSIYYIYIPPEVGGTDGFMTRLSNAQPPPGRKFSGPSGITAGAVMVFGTTSPEELAALGKAFNLIGNVLGNPTGK